MIVVGATTFFRIHTCLRSEIFTFAVCVCVCMYVCVCVCMCACVCVVVVVVVVVVRTYCNYSGYRISVRG